MVEAVHFSGAKGRVALQPLLSQSNGVRTRVKALYLHLLPNSHALPLRNKKSAIFLAGPPREVAKPYRKVLPVPTKMNPSLASSFFHTPKVPRCTILVGTGRKRVPFGTQKMQSRYVVLTSSFRLASLGGYQ